MTIGVRNGMGQPKHPSLPMGGLGNELVFDPIRSSDTRLSDGAAFAPTRHVPSAGVVELGTLRYRDGEASDPDRHDRSPGSNLCLRHTVAQETGGQTVKDG